MVIFRRILTAIIIMQYSINLLMLRSKHVEKLISRKFLHILRDRELRTEPPINRLENSIIEKEVWGSNLRLVKSDTLLPTAFHRCNTSFQKCCYARVLYVICADLCKTLALYTLRLEASVTNICRFYFDCFILESISVDFLVYSHFYSLDQYCKFFALFHQCFNSY